MQATSAALVALVLSAACVHAAPLITVFQAGENGYACVRIPDLLVTLNGTILAFGEARKLNCNDNTWIGMVLTVMLGVSDDVAADLVVKRSTDGGTTWSEMSIVYGNSTSSHYYTIGNAAPIQIASTGQILVPFCRNNALIFITESNDDGLTWSEPREIPGIVEPGWSFVATGVGGVMMLRWWDVKDASGQMLVRREVGCWLTG
jgi:sialidase-1